MHDPKGSPSQLGRCFAKVGCRVRWIRTCLGINSSRWIARAAAFVGLSRCHIASQASRTVEIDVGGIGYQNNGAVWGKPMMVVGTPGGGRIITAVLLTVINPIDYDMNAQEAIDMPRFRKHLLPYLTNLENFAPSPDTR